MPTVINMKIQSALKVKDWENKLENWKLEREARGKTTEANGATKIRTLFTGPINVWPE